MSFQAVAAALEIQDVSVAEKCLLLVLASYAGPRMTCWPSAATLGRDTCMNPRSVKRVLKTLEARGLISRRSRPRGKSQTSNLITLRFDGDTQSPPPVTQSAFDGDRESPEPIKRISKTSRARASELEARASPLIKGKEGSALFAELMTTLAAKKMA